MVRLMHRNMRRKSAPVCMCRDFRFGNTQVTINMRKNEGGFIIVDRVGEKGLCILLKPNMGKPKLFSRWLSTERMRRRANPNFSIFTPEELSNKAKVVL